VRRRRTELDGDEPIAGALPNAIVLVVQEFTAFDLPGARSHDPVDEPPATQSGGTRVSRTRAKTCTRAATLPNCLHNFVGPEAALVARTMTNTGNHSAINRARFDARLFWIVSALISLTAFGPTPAHAGCGCDKPPPPPAQIRPNVTYAGMTVTLFAPSLQEGAAYDVRFTAGTATDAATGMPVSATVQGVVKSARDLADGVVKPQLVVPLPNLPLGPASVVATPVNGNTAAISVSDMQFTVAPTPLAVPTDADEYHFPGYQAAVGRDGVVYISLALNGVYEPLVFEAQARGLAFRFGARDVVFFNAQGFIMQKLVEGSEPVPGMFVFPASNPAADSDLLHYSRHEFNTYFLQHQERQPHSVDPNDPNWHLDGTPHIDHDHLILALLGKMNDGSYPAPGATPAFDLVVDTYSLFFRGLVGASSVTMSEAMTDSYESTTGTPGMKGDVMTNGKLKMSSGSKINGDATAGSFDISSSSIVTGTKTLLSPAVSFMDVKVPTGIPSLGDVRIRNGATLVGPGSFKVRDLEIDDHATLFIDNSRGPVTLYVTGKFEMDDDSAVRVADGQPEHFAVYLPGAQSVVLDGQRSSFRGVLYAPKATIGIKRGDFYGAFVGKTVTIESSARVHYDSTLASDDAPAPASAGSNPTTPGN
jgi:hypothetical protein